MPYKTSTLKFSKVYMEKSNFIKSMILPWLTVFLQIIFVTNNI